MFKYSPINSYTLQNLQNNQVYFNNPLNFNDPFDTIHPATITELSNEILASLLSKYYGSDFEEEKLLKILDRTITRDDFYEFCSKHVDYFFKFDINNEIFAYQSKENYLETIKDVKDISQSQLFLGFDELFSLIKSSQQNTVNNVLEKTRIDLFSKIGVCCFSKNNTNLLMWSHYADSHKGLCLEFDDNVAPFSRSFEVIYDSDIPSIDADLLFKDEHSLETFEKFLSYKSSDWEHEQEIRLLHQEKDKLFSYSRLALKAVYFGIKVTETDKAIVCSLIKAQNSDVRFYQMEKLESSFGIKPREFVYSTPIEVQSMLIIEIIRSFKNKEFSLNELHNIFNIVIEKENLKNHLKELLRIGLLETSNSNYKLKS